MKLVERHVIKKSHQLWSKIDEMSWRSKNLYNYANYIIRQSFIFENKYLNYNAIQKLVQSSEPYKALPAKVSQQVLMVLDRNWKSFFEALKVYTDTPELFKAKAKLPKYKDKERGRNILVYTIQAISKTQLKSGYIKLSQANIRLNTAVKNVQQVRIVPKLDHYVIEVVYEQTPTRKNVDVSKIATIDIGLNNLAAITFNQAGISPLLISGRPLKSINQFFNKEQSRLKSLLSNQSQASKTSKRIQRLCTKRNHKIDDYLHKNSREIINYLVTLQIGTLVIGKNLNSKQDINLGKRNNQNFVQIPQARLIEMLSYKASLVGINVILQEESYTSQSSFLDNDPIPVYQQGEKTATTLFSGKRLTRGLYRSGCGVVCNADVNASYNIMRKAIPNAFVDGIEGIVVSPIRITPGKLAA